MGALHAALSLVVLTPREGGQRRTLPTPQLALRRPWPFGRCPLNFPRSAKWDQEIKPERATLVPRDNRNEPTGINRYRGPPMTLANLHANVTLCDLRGLPPRSGDECGRVRRCDSGSRLRPRVLSVRPAELARTLAARDLN